MTVGRCGAPSDRGPLSMSPSPLEPHATFNDDHSALYTHCASVTNFGHMMTPNRLNELELYGRPPKSLNRRETILQSTRFLAANFERHWSRWVPKGISFTLPRLQPLCSGKTVGLSSMSKQRKKALEEEVPELQKPSSSYPPFRESQDDFR